MVPGISYELLRERTQHPREDSAFIEISRVLLAGTFLTACSIGILFALHSLAPHALIDLPAVIAGGSTYIAHHVTVTSWTIVLQLGFSVLLAVIVNDILVQHPVTTSIVGSNVWQAAFVRKRPRGCNVHLSVQMKDGTQVMGRWIANSNNSEPAKRELLLQGPMIIRLPGENATRQLDERWKATILPGEAITLISVAYIPDSKNETDVGAGERIRGWLAKHWLRWYPAAVTIVVLALVTALLG